MTTSRHYFAILHMSKLQFSHFHVYPQLDEPDERALAAFKASLTYYESAGSEQMRKIKLEFMIVVDE